VGHSHPLVGSLHIFQRPNQEPLCTAQALPPLCDSQWNSWLDGSWRQIAARTARKPQLCQPHASSLHSPKHNAIRYCFLQQALGSFRFSHAGYLLHNKVQWFIINQIANEKQILDKVVEQVKS
jgi:hypothetical protein